MKQIIIKFKKCLISFGLLFSLCLSVSGCSGKSADESGGAETSPPKEYQVYFVIDRDYNLMLSKYEVDILVDDNKIASIENGGNYEDTLTFTEGEHTLTFEKTDDSSVSEEMTFELIEDATLTCKIKTHSDSIEFLNSEYSAGIVKELPIDNVEGMVLSDAVKILADKGFEHVETDSASNVYESDNWIVISQNFEPGTVINKKETIILTCQKINEWLSNKVNGMNVLDAQKTLSDTAFSSIKYVSFDSHSDITSSIDKLDTDYLQNCFIESVEAEGMEKGNAKLYVYHKKEIKDVSFPKEDGLRAAVTALTNYYAMDVLTDGIEDPSLFHSFADTSGNTDDYYMKIWSVGEWTYKDDNTWHCSGLKLYKKSNGLSINIACDVTYDGSNYIVSNVKDLNGKSASDTVVYDDNTVYYTVSPEMIEEGRDEEYDFSDSEESDKEDITTIDECLEIINYIVYSNLKNTKSYSLSNTNIQDNTVLIDIQFAGIGDTCESMKNGKTDNTEAWDGMQTSLCEFTDVIKGNMKEMGYGNLDISARLFDKEDTEKCLLQVTNNEVIYDYVNDK